MGYALWFSIFQYTIGSTVLLLIATASERQLTKFNLDPGCSLHEVCTFSQWPSRFTPGDPSFISHPKDIRAGALFDHCKLTLVSWWKYGLDVGWVSNKWSVRTCWATGLVAVLHLSRILRTNEGEVLDRRKEPWPMDLPETMRKAEITPEAFGLEGTELDVGNTIHASAMSWNQEQWICAVCKEMLGKLQLRKNAEN